MEFKVSRKQPLQLLKVSRMGTLGRSMWVVVKIMVPFFGTLNIRCCNKIGIQKMDHNFDNHPCSVAQKTRR